MARDPIPREIFMSFTEGSVIIDVSTPDPGVTAVRTRSTRAGEISQAIIGQACDSPLPVTLIKTLYSLSPQAHLTAYHAACCCAKGNDCQIDSRRVVYEIICEHLRFLAFEAPNKVNLAADPEVRRLGSLRSILETEFNKSEPDYAALDKVICQELEYFVTGSHCLEKFKALDSLPDFEAWMMLGATAASRFFSQLWETVPCRRHAPVPVLDPLTDYATAQKWFTKDFSVNSPLIQGTAHQTGALARRLAHPLISEIAEQYGCGVRANFAARLIDLIEYFKSRENPENIVSAGSPEPGVGIALVQCARGTLTMRVEVANNTLTSATFVPATEWNFAPGGVAQLALETIPLESESQYKTDAAWVLTALDPGVSCQIRILQEL